MTQTLKFAAGDYVVYPAQGVGRIITIENQEVSGFHIQVFVIEFEKNRMTVRVPVSKAVSTGLRHLASSSDIDTAFKVFKKRMRVKKNVWARRLQEYELKINSGCLSSIAEVLRELYKDDIEQSYSERQVYHLALSRMCLEVSLVQKANEDTVIKDIEARLQAA
mgnify:CR=1 FL=1